MNPSKYDRFAVLMRKSGARGSAGEAKQTADVMVEELWVSKPELLSGKFTGLGTKDTSVNKYKIESHFSDAPKPYMRLVVEGVSYDLETVTEIGRGDSLLMTATLTV